MTLLSDAVQSIAPSPSIAVSQLARDMAAQGHDIISLAAGEPDFDTPAHICDAAIQAIRDGHTRYTAVDGIAPLKTAICAKMARDHGVPVTPDHVTVSTGGKQVLFNALMATLNAGDEVIIPAPYWVSYPDMTRLCGGTPVILPCPAQDGFKLTPAALRAAITPRSKWLLLNSPSNPTGAAYSAAELSALMDVVRDHPHLHVLSDDIYEKILFEGEFATPLQVAPDLADRLVILNGGSKAYAMTGWRMGYGIGPVDLIAAMRKIQSQSTTNPCSIAQHAMLAALNGPQDFLTDFNAAYRARRDMVVQAVNAAGLSCDTPQGAFYVYPSVASCIGKRSAAGTDITDDEAFATALLRETGVALVHGAAFGLSPHIRISYAAADDVLRDAMDRITGFVAGLS